MQPKQFTETVTITLSEYNELLTIKKGVYERKVIRFIKQNFVEYWYYLPDDQKFKPFFMEIEDLNNQIKENKKDFADSIDQNNKQMEAMFKQKKRWRLKFVKQ